MTFWIPGRTRDHGHTSRQQHQHHAPASPRTTTSASMNRTNRSTMSVCSLLLLLLLAFIGGPKAFSVASWGSKATAQARGAFRIAPPPHTSTSSALTAHTAMAPSERHVDTTTVRLDDQEYNELQLETVVAPAVPPPGLGKTAIILNVNARSVTSDIGTLARSVFGANHVFVTKTHAEAQQAAAQILRDQYSLAIPVGGDGTLSGFINCMTEQMRRMAQNETMSLEDAVRALPYMAYIPMGTGNGVGSVVGCRHFKKVRKLLPGSTRRQYRRLRQTLQSLKDAGELLSRSQEAGEDVWLPGSSSSSGVDFEVVDMPMIQVAQHSKDTAGSCEDEGESTSNGDLCFFAGIGFDSLMLNDFKDIKAWSQRTGFLTQTLSSVTGYCVALIVKTLPKCVMRGEHNIHVKLTSGDNETLWVDHRRGDCVRRVPSGKELYSGNTGILAAGTSPFYGGGLKLFPFARMTTDKMHLRLGRINPMVGFLNIPQIFAGSYRDPSDRFGCIDFIGADFEVEVSGVSANPDTEGARTKGYPFQHSGESVGHVERFRLKVVQEPVRFVCL